MRLRKPCEHGRYDEHPWTWQRDTTCPGGEFLPEDARVFAADFIKTWRFCPRCGRPNIDQPKEDGVKQCLPTNCDVWVHESTFNHETRQWVAADQVGEPG